MFSSETGLELKGDFLKVSYRDFEQWPQITPLGTIRAHVLDIGDEVSGPNIQLGNIEPVEGETLDWRHSIDPLHHHGSDQFRVTLRGEWLLAGRHQPAPKWSFQESGMVYQEHPRKDSAASLMLIMGDRRGVSPTLAIKKDEETIVRAGGVYELPDAEKPYPHPAGNRGIAAIATTSGSARHGFVWGDFDSAPSCGLLGDAETGPVVYMLKGEPGDVVLPPCSAETELVLTVVEGSAIIDNETYLSADLRVQSAGRPIQAVIAGDEGLKAILVLGDRRFSIDINAGERPEWLDMPKQQLKNLLPQDVAKQRG